ncbi:MAG TPA: hypothetical protein VNG12_15760 [Acidimicrobiales bacterium]|nr:hypothetical protein [Acidimicrobiales bacterium]
MTGNCRPESEELVASAEGAGEATSAPERDEGGCHLARGLELSVDARGSRGNNTADLEKAVRFAPGTRDSGMTDFPDPTSHEPLVDTSRFPSVAGRGVPSTSGFPAANEYTAVDSGELGLRVQ